MKDKSKPVRDFASSREAKIGASAPAFKDGQKRTCNRHTETQSFRLGLNRGSHAKTLSSEETTRGVH